MMHWERQRPPASGQGLFIAAACQGPFIAAAWQGLFTTARHIPHSKHVGVPVVALTPILPSGGFKVNQLPTSPFEGMRQSSGGAASTSSGAGPFAQQRGLAKAQSMDTTSNSASQLDRLPGGRGLGSSASQKHQELSPRSRESPFEAYKQQQQVQQQVSGKKISLCSCMGPPYCLPVAGMC